jgi:GDP-L-fucose synthase
MKRFYKNKKIFIAGGSGLLGTNLLKLFIKNKINVVASYNTKIQEKNLKKFYKRYNFLNYNDCLTATKNQDVVIICAVYATGIGKLKENYLKNFDKNLILRTNLLKSCIQNKVKKIIWISSSTIYQPSTRSIKENELNLNINPYPIYNGTGWQYRYLEKLFEYFNKIKNFDIKIIRTSSIYGPYDNFQKNISHVIPALIKKVFQRNKNFTVWGDKRVVRDFVYVKDLAEAIYNIIPLKKIKFPVNFSYGYGVSIKKLAIIIKKISKTKKNIIFNNLKKSSAPYRVLNNNKVNKLLGYKKRTNLEEGLKETMQWFINEKNKNK